jgi:hypothetical protein
VQSLEHPDHPFNGIEIEYLIRIVSPQIGRHQQQLNTGDHITRILS